MQQLKITTTITKRDSSLDAYLASISKLEMVSPEEEAELSERIQAGDEEALKKLVNSNLRFVVSVAKQYQGGSGMTLTDIIQEGNLGLMKAAEKFDATKGFKFISYAVWWIRQSILQGMAEHGRMVRLPLNQVGSLNKINKAIAKFEQENQRYPNESEIAEILDMEEDKVRETISVSARHTSYDAPFEEGEDGSLLDVLPNTSAPNADKELDKDSLTSDVDRVLMVLSPRERDIIKGFFGIGCQEMTLEELGEKYGLTRERVRQLREKAIRKLHNSSMVVDILRSHM